MSGLGTGIAAFVNGFVGGREIKHGWEDRKDKKEWDKKLQEFEIAAQERTAERHGWARDTHGLNMADGRLRLNTAQQIYDDNQDIRQAMSEADEAARAGMVEPAGGAEAPAGAIPVSTGPQPMGAVAPQPGAAAQEGALGAVPASTGVDVPANATRAPEGAQGGAQPLFAQTPDGKVFAQRPPRDAQEKAQIAQAAKEGRLAQNPAEAGRQAEIDRIGEARATNRLYNTLAPNPEHEYFEPGGVGADVVEGTKAAARARLGAQDMALGALGGAANMVANRPVNAITRWATGRDFGEFGQPDWSGGANDAMPAPRAPAPKGADASKQATVDAAAEVVDEIGQSPSQQAAAEGVELGAQPGRPISPAQRKEKGIEYGESWIKNGAPRLEQEYLRKGMLAEADQVRAFVENRQVQAGIKSWGQAVFAVLNGDDEGAFDALTDAYNSRGYFEDGLEIVKDQSSLIRDDKGKTVGVRLAFRNQETGEVTVSEDRIENVIQNGLWLMSPEKAMENMLAQQAAMQKQMVEIEAENRKTAGRLIEKDFDAINQAALKIMETSKDIATGQPTISYEEALRIAQEGRSGGAGQQTPVLHRPQ